MTGDPRDGHQESGVAVSVIVPVHQDSAGLRRCLTALRAQDLAPERFEIIICDNASTTDPVTPADVAGADLPRVVLLTTGEPGSYRARNQSLEHVRGDVLAFTDADCTPATTWLREGLTAVRGGDAGIVAGEVEVYTSGRPTPLERWESLNAFPQRKYVERMGFGVTANLFVRRDVIDRVGPFAEDLMSGGDREFCQRAGRAGVSVAFAPAAVVAHPARATVDEVATKARRVLIGSRDMGDPQPGALALLRAARPPLGALRRSAPLRTPAARASYVVGEVTAHYIRWWSSVRVARG